jgi:hypothetical protein
MQRGWHPDPDGSGERFHDGARWTGVTRGGPVATPARAPRTTRARRPRRRRSRAGLVADGLTVLVLAGLGASAALLDRGPLTPVTEALGVGGPERLLPEVHPAQRSSAYAILEEDAAGDPVTYDPCEPVHYVVNPDGAPADYADFVGPAVSAAQDATGLRFVDDGTSTESWASRQRGGRSEEPVLIAFVDRLEGDDVTVDTVGLGGSTSVKVDGLVGPHYLGGAIALKRSWFAEHSAHHDTALEQAVVMHELGHVLGLDHVDDRGELMYPSTGARLTYGPGDLAGLAVLGAGHCGP